MKIGIILQARLGSTRLPRKVLMDVNGECVLNRCFSNMIRAKNPEVDLYLATTDLEQDKILLDHAKKAGVNGFCGHPTNLIQRFYSVAQKEELSVICRLTADNPFIDYRFLQQAISFFIDENLKTPAIVTSRGGLLAAGLDVEIFNSSALEKAGNQANAVDQEHVTTGMTEDMGFKVIQISGEQLHPEYSRLTVDFPSDLEIAKDYALKFDINHRSVTNFKVRGL
jgi:spore coat polysaccharide biosynthesis protein SpsF